MSAINATPGASDANAYITQAEADAYFADRVAHSGWTGAADDTKRRVILQATREVDTYFEWLGVSASATQALAFPRVGLYDPDTGAAVPSTIIPNRVKWATAEQAAALLSGDRATELAQNAQGLKRLQAGPVDLEFRDSGSIVRPVLVSAAVQFLKAWGRMAQASLGGSVPLMRT